VIDHQTQAKTYGQIACEHGDYGYECCHEEILFGIEITYQEGLLYPHKRQHNPQDGVRDKRQDGQHRLAKENHKGQADCAYHQIGATGACAEAVVRCETA